MKKYFLLSILFLVSITVFSQGSKIEISNFNYMVNGDENICENIMKFTAVFEDGSERDFFNHTSYREGNHTRATMINTFDKILKSVKVYVYTRERRDGRSCDSGKGSKITQDEIFNVSFNPCDQGDYNVYKRNGGDFEVEHRLSFNWRVSPVMTISRIGSNIAGYEDPVKSIATSGFGNSVYRWQYQVTSIGGIIYDNNWSYIPGISNSESLSVIPESFLPKSSIGKELHIRILSCIYATASNLLSYKLRKSAPHILRYETQDVSCYDAMDEFGNGDGAIKIYFDRSLDTDSDILGIEIKDLYDNSQVKNVNNIRSFDGADTYTVTGLPGSRNGFKLDIIGVYNSQPYYTEGDNHAIEKFDIIRPSPVAFNNNPATDYAEPFCYDGEDGTIYITGIGGTNSNYEYLIKSTEQSWSHPEVIWRSFANATSHTIRILNSTQGISAGTYHIKIRDANGCVAKRQDMSTGELRLGEEIIKEVVIGQPEKEVDIEISLRNNPRAYGFEDGRINARIFGGTDYLDGSYKFEWRDEEGNTLSTVNTENLTNDNEYLVILHSVGKGLYTLTAWDANYTSATDKEGCFSVSTTYNLTQPDPLTVAIEILNTISCNNENDYSNGADFEQPLGQPDQFQDGILIATVSGGVPFDTTTFPQADDCRENRTEYCYFWKKQNPDGSWSSVGDNHSIIRNRSTGTFALNIEDNNGIQLGTYEPYQLRDGSREYRLQTAIDSTQFLDQPDKLEVDFVKTSISCAKGNDAMAEALVVGGTPPYTYRWSTGADTKSATDLIAGTYLVYIEDTKGCQLEGSVSIEQPNGLEIIPVDVISPTCYQGSDGVVNVEITGGTPPYQYEWSTGETSLSRNNLSAGTYRIQVADAEGCLAFKDFILEDPLPVFVNLEATRSLCGGQSVVLDITIDDPNANYQWEASNGFKSSLPQVEISESGIYTATITSGLGCIGTSDISIETFDTPIDADFLLTTQAYVDEEIILVNVSEPLGNRVEWTIPETAEIISTTDEKLILRFEAEGPYDINLRSYQSDCYQDFSKTILVQPAIENIDAFAAQGDFIEEFIVYPNPNPGTFKAKISLAEASNITVKIVNLISGAVMNERSEKNQQEFLLNYEMGLPTGVYLMLLETPKGSETRKLVFE